MKTIILVVFASLLTESTYFASEQEKIIGVLRTFSEAYRTKNLSLLDSIFADEVTCLDADPKIGITDRSYLFKKGFKPVMNEKKAIEMDFKTIKIHNTEDNGYVAGYFRYFQEKAEGGEYFYGKFAMFLVKDHGENWKITLDMHNLCPKKYWDSALSEIIK